jgi:hypothetical protein
MKLSKFAIIGPILLAGLSVNAQNAKGKNEMEKTLQELQDRAALKEVVDTFSNLADTKEVHTQVQLFTPDATMEAFTGGKSTGTFKGRDEMERAFGAFLANFQVVYHFNGQQVVKIEGDKASGISYCTVTLIGIQAGKRTRTTMGVHYKDEFVRENGRWLISHRISNCDWQDREEMSQLP